jgi:hypothetical protein
MKIFMILICDIKERYNWGSVTDWHILEPDNLTTLIQQRLLCIVARGKDTILSGWWG